MEPIFPPCESICTINEKERMIIVEGIGNAKKATEWFECDLSVLASLFSMTNMPDSAKTKTGEFEYRVQVKKERVGFPSFQVQMLMRDCEQNGDDGVWYEFRVYSFGGSGWAAFCNLCPYGNTPIKAFLVDSGRIGVQPSNDYSDYYAMNLGHWNEPESIRIYEHLMNAKVTELGMVLDPVFEFIHISPDGLVEINPGTRISKYTESDALYGLLELKAPRFKVYATKKKNRATVPHYYLLQLMGQVHVFQVNWVDFLCHWRVDPGIGQPIYIEPGKYKVGESFLSRVYRNKLFIDKMYQFLHNHRRHLRSKPKDQDQTWTWKFEETEIEIRSPMPDEIVYLYVDMKGDGNWKHAEEQSTLCVHPHDKAEDKEVVKGVEENEVQKEKIHLSENIEPELPKLNGDENINSEICKKRKNKNMIEIENIEEESIKRICIPGIRFEVNEQPTNRKKSTLHILYRQEHMERGPLTWISGVTKLKVVYPPKVNQFDATKMPDIVMLPLKKITFILETPNKSDITSLKLENGSFILNGTISAHIDHLSEQKPLKISFLDFMNKSDTALELDQVPPPEPCMLPKNVKNPLWKFLLNKYPDLDLSEIIRRFCAKQYDEELVEYEMKNEIKSA